MTERPREQIEIQEDQESAKRHAEQLVANMRKKLTERRDVLQKRLGNSMDEYKELTTIIEGLYLNAEHFFRAAEHFRKQEDIALAQEANIKVHELYNRLDNLEFERETILKDIKKLSDEMVNFHLKRVSAEE